MRRGVLRQDDGKTAVQLNQVWVSACARRPAPHVGKAGRELAGRNFDKVREPRITKLTRAALRPAAFATYPDRDRSAHGLRHESHVFESIMAAGESASLFCPQFR